LIPAALDAWLTKLPGPSIVASDVAVTQKFNQPGPTKAAPESTRVSVLVLVQSKAKLEARATFRDPSNAPKTLDPDAPAATFRDQGAWLGFNVNEVVSS